MKFGIFAQELVAVLLQSDAVLTLSSKKMTHAILHCAKALQIFRDLCYPLNQDSQHISPATRHPYPNTKFRGRPQAFGLTY